MLVEQALEAKREMVASKSDYDSGKLMAYYAVISLLQQQAKAFEIPLKEIGLDGITPDIDLL
jgi:hypothetical protein